MKRYFDAFEATTPDFLARVWIGDSYTAEHAHRGRSIDTVRTVVPMGELGGDSDLILQKAGAGRLYYRLGLRYAPSDLRLDPRDEGFVVVRTYEAIDEPSDVVRNDDGSWTIAPGAMVRVRLSMVADSTRTNMALVDHLPAGLEALNPALAASPRPPPRRRGPRSNPPLGTATPGTTTRASATTAARRTAPTLRPAPTTTPTWPGPPHPGRSWSRRPGPRRSTRPRCSAAQGPTGSPSADGRVRAVGSQSTDSGHVGGVSTGGGGGRRGG